MNGAAAAAAAAAASSFSAPPLPLCTHCGLPVAGLFTARPHEPLFCCGGCALAYRVTGGTEGHGQAVGLLMSIGIGAYNAVLWRTETTSCRSGVSSAAMAVRSSARLAGETRSRILSPRLLIAPPCSTKGWRR